ncbi:MAG: hypothetical protein NTZ67_04565 [Gammaproteobacteria bacterium]|nr:hypothetical protein [Gammaproteobacteria bacterium]
MTRSNGNAQDPLLPKKFSASLQSNSYTEKILSNILSENTLIPGILNFVRDGAWAFISYDLLNARLHQSNDSGFDAQSQWFSQQLYSTIAMFLSLVAMAAFYKIKKPLDKAGHVKNFPWAHGFIYLIAAATAIYGWDRMQVLGITTGKNKLTLSDNNAGYFAALFTGLEGFMQYFTIVLLRTLTLSGHYTAAKKDPIKFSKQFLAGMGCSLTFVLLPGANWQVVFMLSETNNWGAVPSSVAVASTVAFFNYVSVKMSIAFLSCHKETGAEEDKMSDTASNCSNASLVQIQAERTDHLPEEASTEDTPLEDAPLRKIASLVKYLKNKPPIVTNNADFGPFIQEGGSSLSPRTF